MRLGFQPRPGGCRRGALVARRAERRTCSISADLFHLMQSRNFNYDRAASAISNRRSGDQGNCTCASKPQQPNDCRRRKGAAAGRGRRSVGAGLRTSRCIIEFQYCMASSFVRRPTSSSSQRRPRPPRRGLQSARCRLNVQLFRGRVNSNHGKATGNHRLAF